MIFVTVGNDLPFSRLTEHADLWSKSHPGQAVFAQTGQLQASDYVPRFMPWVERLTADEFDRHCSEAKLIVAHAGMGSIITALTAGKPIVILPRLARLKEHRNDHQLATARRFEGRSGIFVAWSEADLGLAIERALTSAETSAASTLARFAPEAFTDRLREYILYARRPPG